MARRFKLTFSLGLLIGVILAVAAFGAGVYVASDFKAAGASLLIHQDDFAEDAPKHPFSLRIVRRRNKETGKYEVFLFDPYDTESIHRIDHDLHTVRTTEVGTDSLMANPEEDMKDVMGLIHRRVKGEAKKLNLVDKPEQPTDSKKDEGSPSKDESEKEGDAKAEPE